MKTDVKVCVDDEVNRKPVVQSFRRCLHPLQEAATDKENLVGGGMLSVKENVKALDVTPTKRQRAIRSAEKRSISVEDLTSEGTPSIAYLETLCEKQRASLEEALAENRKLHDKIIILEKENAQAKILLEETQALIETLTEIINSEDSSDEK